MDKFDSVLDKAIEDAKARKKTLEDAQKQEEQRLLASNLPVFIEVLRKAIGQELLDVMTFEYCDESSDRVKAIFSYKEANFEIWRWRGTHSITYFLAMYHHKTRLKAGEIPNQFFNADRLMLAVDEMYNG